MNFTEQLASIAARIPKQTSHLQTEAATSTALVLPFIRALGYDPFDPSEVVPEFTADVGIKKGEKVDYAIMRDGIPAMLFEVKCWDVDLAQIHASQLYRYFSVTDARFGVLTNGIVYRFYTDLDESNKMDSRPFLEFSMLELKDSILEALRDFCKDKFSVDSVLEAATELKYMSGIKKAIGSEFSNPSEDFVKHFARTVYSGPITKAARVQFTDIVKRALQQFINDRISERLQIAINDKTTVPEPVSTPRTVLPDGVVAIDGDIITTEEEVEGHRIVRAIAAGLVDVDRIVMKDCKSYCGILFDNNNRKPVVRLYFNTPKKSVAIFDTAREEQRYPIESLSEIYNFSEQIRAVVSAYVG